MSEGLAALTRDRPQDLVGKRVPELVPDAWKTIGPLYERAARGETVRGVEVEVLLAPGIPMQRREVHLLPIRDDDGSVWALALAVSEEPMRRRAESALQSQTALYAMLSRAGRAASLARSREELLRDVCEIAAESGQFVFAWVGEPRGDRVAPISKAGNDLGYVDEITVSLDPSDARSRGPAGQAVLTGEPSVWPNMLSSPRFAPWSDAARAIGLQSCASFPFLERGRVVAVLSVYARDPHFFTPDLVAALADLGPTVSLALDALAQERDRLEDERIRRELEEQLRQIQKMEAVGVLAGGVAHDFNNTLTVIRNTCDLLHQELDREEERSYLRQIEAAAEHAASLTRQLLTFSRRQLTQRVPIDVDEVMSAGIKLARRLVRESIELEVRLGAPGARVLIDRGELEQILLNLTVNAGDAMPRGGVCTLSTDVVQLTADDLAETVGLQPGDYLRLRVSDTGVGMSPTTLQRIFEPFFTTKDLGTGLGLSTVFGIVNGCGGAVRAESAPGEGTTVTVHLPLLEASGAETVVPDRPAPQSLSGTELILLVEDSDMLRPITAQMLRARGYRVLEAADGPSAIAVAEQTAERIDVLVTDVVMPGPNGREVAQELQRSRPELKVVFTSGYPTDTVLRHGIAEARVAFVQKPYLADELLAAVRGELDGRDHSG